VRILLDTEAPDVNVRDTAERDTPALLATSSRVTAMLADLSDSYVKSLNTIDYGQKNCLCNRLQF
jgi:hypothetical protein